MSYFTSLGCPGLLEATSDTAAPEAACATPTMLNVSPASGSVSLDSNAAALRVTPPPSSCAAPTSSAAAGLSLTLATDRLNRLDLVKPSLSVAVTATFRLPTSALSGVPLKVPLAPSKLSQEGR